MNNGVGGGKTSFHRLMGTTLGVGSINQFSNNSFSISIKLKNIVCFLFENSVMFVYFVFAIMQ